MVLIMPKPISLDPVQIAAGKWRLNVPESVSPTGSRQRLFFPTKREAVLEAERLRSISKLHGTEATRLPASQADDAARALDLLHKSGNHITLVSVVREWLQAETRRTASPTLAELFAEHEERKAGHSASYLRGIDRVKTAVIPRLGKKKVSDIEPNEIERVLSKTFKTPSSFNFGYRTLKPVFSLAVQRGYVTANQLDRIEKRRTPIKEIDVLTVAEAKALFNACTDHTNNEDLHEVFRLDCSGCIPAFAAMLFAGIRPGKVERIEWSDVNLDEATIRIQGKHAKTRSARVIDLEDNCVAWLATVPTRERQGRLVPPGWQKKTYAVRKSAGISGRADVLRHSFASYHLAGFGDVNRTRAAMGHEVGDVLFTNYRAIVRKPDAVRFWSIRPDGTAPQMKATA